MLTYILILVLFFAFLFAVILLKSVYLVQQSEAIVIESFGRFSRVLGPGLHFIIPFIETPRSVSWSYITVGPDKRYYKYNRSTYRIDLRESVNDFPKQNVITKDNVNMEINALLYYQITDPKAAIYEVQNVPEAIEKLTQTTLRNVIGSMDLDETLISRDAVNTKLRIILDEATDKWGVKVNRVELQEVNPPADIRHAMEKQMRAERDRRAIIIESEGQKQSAILQAEGEREANILKARGLSEAMLINAEAESASRLKIIEAESKAVEMIKKVSPANDPLIYLATLQYIKTIPSIMDGKDNKFVVVPYEATGLTGSLSVIKKLFEDQQRKQEIK